VITTPVCALLGIEIPVFNAPMAGTANGTLAAAVSNAGGFGMIGGTDPDGPDGLREQIRIARSLTSRPFGVGFISAFPGIEDLVAVAIEERVTAIGHSFVDPTPWVAPTHEAGTKIVAQVQTLERAIVAARAGVDLIVAQGGEAGGHGGGEGTFALLPAVVDAVAPVPVIAAGGIGDGRGFAAALMLGAQGVWMGTRFVASAEWGGHEWEKRAIVAATADDTVQTRLYDILGERPFPAANPDRMLKNRIIEEWRGREDEIPRHREAVQAELLAYEASGDLLEAGVSAGVVSGIIRDLLPAAEIVRSIAAEAEAVMRERARAVLG
jgi:nitronate monooxygenase